METEAVFVLLFVVATAVAITSRWVRVPYTVALVLAGLVLGALDVLDPPHLTQELLFAVILPGLLFEAAYHVDYSDFRRHIVPISSLAVPGVIAAIGLTAVILTPVADALHFVEGFTWEHGLLFGAIIAATDPIAVVSLFKTMGAPRDLGVLVEGESLLNDGTAIVFFSLLLALVGGQEVTTGEVVVDFVVKVGGGVAVGAAVGVAAAEVMKRLDDPMVEITLTTIAAYGGFVAAEHFHFSGVIATVTAGMLCGNYAATQGMSPSTRISVETFWEYLAFALNSIVFLLIGFEVELATMLEAWRPILAAYLAVVVSRAVVVGVVTGALRTSGRRIPWSWAAVLAWGGLRGAISMVLALSLSAIVVGGPELRMLLVNMTFGVVTLVILVHGLTIPLLLGRLGLTYRHRGREAFELTRGRLQVASRGLEVVRGMARDRFTDADLLARLEREYEERVRGEERRIQELHLEYEDLRHEELLRTRRRLLFTERREASEAHRKGLLSQHVYEHLVADIDARMLRLDEGKWLEEEPTDLASRETGADEGSPPDG